MWVEVTVELLIRENQNWDRAKGEHGRLIATERYMYINHSKLEYILPTWGT